MNIIDTSFKAVNSAYFGHRQCKLSYPLSQAQGCANTRTHTAIPKTLNKANPTISGLGVKFNTRVKNVVLI